VKGLASEEQDSNRLCPAAALERQPDYQIGGPHYAVSRPVQELRDAVDLIIMPARKVEDFLAELIEPTGVCARYCSSNFALERHRYEPILVTGYQGHAAGEPVRVAFLLVPGFSFFTLSCAIEAFRVANEHSGATRFDYMTVAAGEDLSVKSWDGLRVTTDWLMADCPPVRMIFVIASLQAAEFFTMDAARWLRRRAYAGTIIAAPGSGTVLAAKVGLLDGYACVTHWRLHDEFQERFPRVRLQTGLYVIDRDRMTSGGGLATYDLALAIVAGELGAEAAADIADQMLHARIRQPAESPRMALPLRYGVTDERVATAIAAMEGAVEQPLGLAELAELAGSSPRQLQRLFVAALGQTPHQVYASIRLRMARQLLQQSTLSITDIALRCGFVDASHFTKRYRVQFGQTPSTTRRYPGRNASPA
jgi:transcriptional regulator GlxA family with amidase domain